MAEILPLVLLVIAFVVGLLLIPFGLPGIWLMVLALLGYALLGSFETVGVLTVVAVVVLAVIGEVTDALIGFGCAKKFGGSSRAGWGAVAGGLVGTIVGTPIPVMGNLIGAFLGAFLGAVLFEYTRQRKVGGSLSAGWGALIGRAAAAAIKVGLGLAIAVIGIFAALA